MMHVLYIVELVIPVTFTLWKRGVCSYVIFLILYNSYSYGIFSWLLIVFSDLWSDKNMSPL